MIPITTYSGVKPRNDTSADTSKSSCTKGCTETPNQHAKETLQWATSSGIAPNKEGKETDNKETVSNRLANVFLCAMIMLWTPQLSHKKQLPIKKRKNIARQDDASNVANKATSHTSVPRRKTGRAHSPDLQAAVATAPSKSKTMQA